MTIAMLLGDAAPAISIDESYESEPMATIVIDYTPAIRQRAGIGRIIRGQVEAFLTDPTMLDATRHDVRLFVNGRITPADQQSAPLPLHTTPLDERNMVRLWHRLNLPFPLVEWFIGGPIDLLHATDFVLPPSRARQKIVTVHDLAFLFYPNAAMPSLQHYLNVVVPRSVQRADILIADSHHTATDLQTEWNISADRIVVVQGAVDHDHFYPITDQSQLNSVRERYHIGTDPYILALSRLEPRKNFARLIKAYFNARQSHNIPHRLVIGGSKGWLFDDIFAKVEELRLQNHVLFPGFIDDAHLPALYSGAEFFAYPSLYEGFGLPIIEALACGTPVLTADNSCLPEAGGPGALYVQAEDVDSITAGIIRLCEEHPLREQLRTAGLQHASCFTWSRSAQQLQHAYSLALQ